MGIQLRYTPNLTNESLIADCTMLAQVGHMDFYKTPKGRLILRWSDKHTDFYSGADNYPHEYRLLTNVLVRLYKEGKL